MVEPDDRVVFDVNNPPPEFAMLPAEYVFVTRDAATRTTSTVTAGSPAGKGDSGDKIGPNQLLIFEVELISFKLTSQI